MRIKQLKEFQESKKIYASVIFYNDPNFTYLSGLKNVQGVLIIPTKKPPVLYVSEIEKGIAKKHSKVRNIKVFKKILSSLPKKKKIGINKRNITVYQSEILKKKLKNKLEDISNELSNLRKTKTSKEISLMRKTCNLAAKIMDFAIKKASKNLTEMQLKKLIEMEMLRKNLEPSFTTIVASGKNSGNPHHNSENKKLKGFTIIDLGVKYKNYCSDMTRTIYIGKPSKKEIKDYEKVEKVQEKSLKLNTKKCSELFSNAKKELGKEFIHSLGHGIGIEVHEAPYIGKSKETLENNMTFTIEPGIYNKNRGIRIEDTVLLSNNKVFILTKLSKKLKIKK